MHLTIDGLQITQSKIELSINLCFTDSSYREADHFLHVVKGSYLTSLYSKDK